MEKWKLVLTIIDIVILVMNHGIYLYFSKPGRERKENQQTINQAQNDSRRQMRKKKYRKNTSGDELEKCYAGKRRILWIRTF